MQRALSELQAPRFLLVVLIAAILLGIGFRFYNLDRKVYWNDEIYSTLRILGHTEAEIVARSASLTSVQSLQAYLHAGGDVPRNGVGATISSLEQEEPQHPPLYFVLAHYWVRLAGDSLEAERLLSAVFGVLAIPCMFWLGMELFRRPLIAAIASALTAVSPVFVVYSQEVREYELWALLVIVMSALFLRALRVMTPQSWIGYGVTATAALYVYPFTAFAILANLACAIVWSRRDGRRAIVPAAASSVIPLALFLPWAMVAIRNYAPVQRGIATMVARHMSPVGTLSAFVGTLKLAFADFDISRPSPVNAALSVGVVCILGFAVRELIVAREIKALTFVAILAAFCAAPLLLPDLFTTGARSANPRYFFPVFACIDLATAFLLASLVSRNVRWSYALVALLALGAYSCALSSRSDTWWSKAGENSKRVAAAVNESTAPVIVSDNHVDYALSLSNYLREDTRFYLRPMCYVCAGAAPDSGGLAAAVSGAGPGNLYVLGISPGLSDQLAKIATSAGSRTIEISYGKTGVLDLW